MSSISLLRLVLISCIAIVGVGCKDVGSTSIRFYQENPGEDYLLSADPFTLETARITLHDVSDPVCDDTKNNCIHVDINGDFSVDIANIPVGDWYVWTGGFADHKSWSGASCSFTVVKGGHTDHNVVLEPGVGTSICTRIEQGVEVELKDMDGNDFPVFNNGTVTLHKTDDRICDGTTGTCITASMDGHPGAIFPEVEPTNWFIWAGGIAGYQAYAGYPCRFDVPADATTYQEVRMSEGTGTRACNE